MANLAHFLLYNYSLTFFLLGLTVSVLSILARLKSINREQLIEALIRWFVFFSIGASYLTNAIMHTVFAEMSAHFIGWADSPFQQEVGFASLGFAMIGFIAFRGAWQSRLCSIFGPSCFLLGAAGGHVYQMVTASNFSPGNAGMVFYMDIFLPIFGWLLLYLSRPSAMQIRS